jgi:hypothetical protein
VRENQTTHDKPHNSEVNLAIITITVRRKTRVMPSALVLIPRVGSRRLYRLRRQGRYYRAGVDRTQPAVAPGWTEPNRRSRRGGPNPTGGCAGVDRTQPRVAPVPVLVRVCSENQAVMVVGILVLSQPAEDRQRT